MNIKAELKKLDKEYSVKDYFVLLEEKTSGFKYVVAVVGFKGDTKTDIKARAKNEIDTRDFKVISVITESQAQNYMWY